MPASFRWIRANELIASANTDADTSVTDQPANLVLTVEPGTTKLSADWDPVMKSTSYQVRWRLRRQSFAADASRTSTESDAEIDLPSQGDWIIRVQACNHHGCGKPATSSSYSLIFLWWQLFLPLLLVDRTAEVYFTAWEWTFGWELA